MKKKFKKIICIFLIVMTLFSFIGKVKAFDIEKTLDGVAGVIFWIPRAIFMGVGKVGENIIHTVARMAGEEEEAADNFSPWSIISNQIKIVDINFFDLDPDNFDEREDNTVYKIRMNIATWYYALRNLSTIALLCVLIYIAIRMAISTVAGEQAAYKKMLVHWVESFVLLFMLQFIIIITINLNGALVEMLRNSVETFDFAGFKDSMWDKAIFTKEFIESMGGLIMYFMIIAMMCTFLFIYIKRFITVGFLILISPLIAITYSIDKIGDGKSQALNTWLKEFIYNVIIQVFHCILYIVFASTALQLSDGTLGSTIFAIIMLRFIWKGEEILKQIFGVNSSHMAGGAATAALVMGGANKIGGMIGGIGAKKDKKEGGGGEEEPAKKPQTKETPKETQNNNANNGGNNDFNDVNKMNPNLSQNASNNSSNQGGQSSQASSTSTPSANAQKSGFRSNLSKVANSRAGRIARKVGGVTAKVAFKGTSIAAGGGIALGSNQGLMQAISTQSIVGGVYKAGENIIGRAADYATTGKNIYPNEKQLQKEYNEAKDQVANDARNDGKPMNNEELKQRMREKTQEFLAVSPEELSQDIPQVYRNYAERLHKMKALYDANGEKGSKKIQETLKKVEDNKIFSAKKN